MAHRVCNLAVVSPWIRTYVIRGDVFPEAVIRYSINRVPHLVINERVHMEGIVDEKVILEHIATSFR
jgi:alkyl hydroperoxide reductase subunit AhpF